MIPDWVSSAPTLIAVAVVLAGLSLRIAALGIIPGGRRPATGMAWLLVILFTPIFGFLMFLLFGSTTVGRKRSAQQRRANEMIAAAAEDVPELREGSALPAYVHSVAALNRNLGALPITDDNQVDFLPDYSASINAMADAVAEAHDYVYFEFYITAWDDVTAPLFDALVAATERGVSVRMLFDHLGSRGIPGYKEMTKKLDATAIQWHPMLPIQPLKRRFRRPDLRNHRKLLVVDGEIGFMGSQNITEPGYNKPKNHALGREWVELMCRLRGPVVTSLEAVFATDWYTEAGEVLSAHFVAAPEHTPAGVVTGVPGQIVPSGPGFVTENNLRMFTSLIYSARERISLTSPYFVPDESLLYAVTTAAQRGIDIELFVSELSDQFMVGHAQASYYRALLEAGVKIYLYPAPYILHSKHFSIDDDVAVIGSSNMDMRSFALNYEISLMLAGPEVVAAIRAIEDSYRAKSRELTLEEWAGRPAGKKYVDNVMRLTAALQ